MSVAGDLLIRNAAIVNPGATRATVEDIDIRQGLISRIGPGLDATVGQQDVDAAGRSVIPGLIDAHFHAYAVTVEDAEIERLPMSYVALKGSVRLRRALQRGFTTVRDVAGGDLGLTKAIDEGIIAAPRYLFTGPALSQTGGHGDPRDGLHEDPELLGGHSVLVVDGVENLRHVARELFRRGACAIKMLTSGGVISLTDPLMAPQYTAEEIKAVVEVARLRGSYVTVHAYSKEAVTMAVECGVRCIEHGNFIDERTAQLMQEHHVYLVATLVPYDAMARRGAQTGLSAAGQAKNKLVFEHGFEAIRIAHAAGVAVGFGTDLMGDLENEQLRGLELQSKALGWQEALRSATEVNAEIIRMPKAGRIAAGFYGDLVILDGDIFTEPSLLWDAHRPRHVIKGGSPIES